VGELWSGLPYDRFLCATARTRNGVFELVFCLGQDSEVSAMCCTRGSTLVTRDRAPSRLPTITVRLSPEEKLRFTELAASRGLSECALAIGTLRALLIPGTPSTANVPSASAREAATDRITIRLRPGDGAALEARAARRQMKTSTYLAALVRSHIAADAVLTAHELETVKQAVVVLAGVGRVLSKIARCGSQGGALSPEVRQALAQTRSVVATVEQRISDLARAALRSWESRYE